VRVLVMTVVHHPGDARIAHRQIPALLAAGHQVTYAAPFAAYGVLPPPGVEPYDLPRAHGQERTAALRAARGALARRGAAHDVVLLHDPELLMTLPGLSLPPVVWDVHEDTASAVSMKAWLPEQLKPLAVGGVRSLERWAEKHVSLLLAEDAYAARFTGVHPVVPNTTTVPSTVSAPGTDRVVYLGAVTRPRGAIEMIELALLLKGLVSVELIGPVHPDVADEVAQAHGSGALVAHGFVPNDQAVRLLDGALAGLSLLHDEPNYRHSRPTKVIEYMAHGVPVVTTPLPVALDIVEQAGSGVVVDFLDAPAAAAAILALRSDPARRERMGAAGHAAALEKYDWSTQGPLFVAALESAAASAN